MIVDRHELTQLTQLRCMFLFSYIISKLDTGILMIEPNSIEKSPVLLVVLHS